MPCFARKDRYFIWERGDGSIAIRLLFQDLFLVFKIVAVHGEFGQHIGQFLRRDRFTGIIGKPVGDHHEATGGGIEETVLIRDVQIIKGSSCFKKYRFPEIIQDLFYDGKIDLAGDQNLKLILDLTQFLQGGREQGIALFLSGHIFLQYVLQLVTNALADAPFVLNDLIKGIGEIAIVGRPVHIGVVADLRDRDLIQRLAAKSFDQALVQQRFCHSNAAAVLFHGRITPNRTCFSNIF